MDNSIENCVSKSAVSYSPIPFTHGKLAYHHRRTVPVTVVEDLHQVVSLGLGQLLKTPVVYYQKSRFPKLTQKLSVASIGFSLGKGKKQP